MRKTKQEAEVTREKLLDASLIVFSKKGYSAATLDDIAKEAGVTRGAIYWHFKGGKEDLMVAIINHGIERVSDMLKEEVAAEEEPLDKIERMMVRSLEFIEEDWRYQALQEILIFKTGDEPEINARLVDKQLAQRESLNFVTGLVEQAKAAGKVRKDIDPMDAALAIYGAVNGIALLWMVERSINQKPQFSLKERAKSLIRIVMNGITGQ